MPDLSWEGRPDSRKLAEALRTAIRDGRLPAGFRLPSTRALAHDLGVARGTVTRAYDQLSTEGFLLSRQGAATTVAERLTTSTPDTPQPPPSPPHAPRWDFRPGRPDLNSFPRKEWLSAGRRALHAATVDDLDYGDPQGHPTLRAALADYLGRVRAVVTAPERIVVCNGYGEALSLLTKALRDQGVDAVDVEDPTQPQFRATAEDAGLSVRGVPVDDHGLDVAEVRGNAVIVTPAHQFPLGVAMSSARRTELIQRAKTDDRVVVEDDYDGDFRFDRPPVGALQGMAPEHVAYAGTASKTLAPALRIAWLALPSQLVEPVRALKTRGGLHAPLFEQLTLAELIRTGAYDQHVRRCRATYRQRRAKLVEALTATPHRLHPAGISAGLHLTVWLDRNGPDEREVLARAWERSVELDGLAAHWVGPEQHPPGVVIGYAAPAGQSFRPALRTLVDVLGTR